MKIHLCLAVAAIIGFGAGSASADQMWTFSGESEFSGSLAGNLVGSVKVELFDVGGKTNLQVTVSGFQGSQRLKQLYLNQSPFGGAAGPTNYAVDGSFDASGPLSIEADQDAYRANGIGGYFDILVEFDGNQGLGNGVYKINQWIGGPSANLIEFNKNADGTGPAVPLSLLSAIHVGDNDQVNERSGWYGLTTTTVPEPGTYALFGLALGAGYLIRRRRRCA